MSFNASSIAHIFSKQTPFFGLKLWIPVVICIGLLVIFIVLCTSLCFCCHRRRRRQAKLDRNYSLSSHSILLRQNGWDNYSLEKQWSGRAVSGRNIHHLVDIQPVVSGSLSQCKNFLESEILLATDSFSCSNLIGSGEFGVVYRGLLFGNTIAVKKLVYRSGTVEDFIGEVETNWCIRHKNLVKLLGYCVEGTKRMVVYEYVDNGNLQQWLHECTARISPLTWNTRMKIIIGTAKGLAYLHEDTESIIVHQHLKSSNILLDRQWNPKISDVGITNLLGPEWSNSIAFPVGMSGYIAPEYASKHLFDEKSDVYSFGILVMEIISGRTPIEYSEFEIEVYLVDWLKSLVANHKFDEILDPKLPEPPSLKELKRVILIALRCVDPDVENRPKMGDVIHMLEPRDLLLTDVIKKAFPLLVRSSEC